MAFSATKRGGWMNLGSQQACVWRIVHDGSTGYFDTGLNDVLFAIMVSETDSGDLDMMCFNSNDGTKGSAMGYVYFDNEGNGDITYILVIGH